MAKKIGLLSLVVVIVVSLGVFTLKGLAKEQRREKEYDLETTSEKIDELLKNQQDIIARLEDIRDQQDIIRIRASRK